MTRGRRLRIAKGIYRDASGIAGTVHVGRRQREKRFPPDTDLETIQAWQRRTRGELLLEEPPSTVRAAPRRRFIRDAVRWLQSRKGLPSYAADRSHLQAWVERFGHRNRATITTQDVQLAIADWRTKGQRRRHQTRARPIAPQTLRHRLRVLRAVYRFLDGDQARTPCDAVEWPTPAKRPPRDVKVQTIRRVLEQLATRYPADHARLLVLASTGRRPAEVMRTNPATDLDLARHLWRVPPAKAGEPTTLHLNREMVDAWRALLARNATGPFDTGLYAKRLRRCGWPSGLRPYNVRHAVAMAILRAGGDLGDVQIHLGHTSIDTTKRFYVGLMSARARHTSKRLEGRVPSVPVPSERVPSGGRARTRKHATTGDKTKRR